MRLDRVFLIAVLMVAGMAWQGCAMVDGGNGEGAATDASREVLFQASTIDALLAGVYDGDMSFREVKRHGDFGLGTLQALDGELVGVDGEFYQVKTDGNAYPVADLARTPFVAVTFFDADYSVLLQGTNAGFAALQSSLDTLLPNKNVFYAIRIDGEFSYVKTRSVPAQTPPYPKLVDVVKTESKFFEFHNVKGTLVGFWCPAYVQGINVPGYHIHFLTADRKHGGHVLECRLTKGTVWIDMTPGFEMVLPRTKAFADLDLTKKTGDELHKVESETAAPKK